MAQMELQSGSHISLMSCTFDTWMGICMEWYANEVMHSKTRRCKLHVWWILGGVRVEMHIRTIFPTGIYKGIFAQVQAYARFYKCEKIHTYAKSSFCAYVHFRMKVRSFINETPVIFSLAQVRCFWQCFCFRSGLVALFLKMSERGDSWCTDSSFSSLLVKLSQVF